MLLNILIKFILYYLSGLIQELCEESVNALIHKAIHQRGTKRESEQSCFLF